MVADVADRLANHGGDFLECVAVEEMEAHHKALGLGERFVDPPQGVATESGFDRIFVGVGESGGLFRPEDRFLQFEVRIESAGDKIAPAIKGPVVGDLDEPGAGGAALRIEETRFPEDKEKDLLDKIFGFRGITNNPFR